MLCYIPNKKTQNSPSCVHPIPSRRPPCLRGTPGASPLWPTAPCGPVSGATHGRCARSSPWDAAGDDPVAGWPLKMAIAVSPGKIGGVSQVFSEKKRDLTMIWCWFMIAKPACKSSSYRTYGRYIELVHGLNHDFNGKETTQCLAIFGMGRLGYSALTHFKKIISAYPGMSIWLWVKTCQNPDTRIVP